MEKVDEFRVLGCKEQIPEGYSLANYTQVKRQSESVAQAYHSSSAFTSHATVRLKNGLIIWKTEGNEQIKVEHIYEEELQYKLVTSQKRLQYKLLPHIGQEDELTEEECLIALAYAAEHDDVEEVEEVVKCAGKEILKKRMPFGDMGTILHVCMNWASLKTLVKVLTDYPESVDVYILDRDRDTALHNLPNHRRSATTYEDFKRAACLILGLHGVDANRLLSDRQNNYGRMCKVTPLCKALVWRQRAVCCALLDAGLEMCKKEKETTSAGASPHDWLKLTVHGSLIDEEACDSGDSLDIASDDDDEDEDEDEDDEDEDDDDDDNDNLFCTALHLAVRNEYGDIVKRILDYPGAAGLNLTSLEDHNGNTPLHAAAKVGKHDICSMLLKYGMEINKGGGSVCTSLTNNVGETPLHIASTHGHVEVCEKLLEYDASLSTRDKHGRYALTNAFAKNHKQVVEKLLDACLPTKAEVGAEAQAKPELTKSRRSLINEKFQFGITPLHVAVAISSWRHIHGLIKAGASVDSTSGDGRTPLHIASQQYDQDVIIEILQNTTEKNLAINSSMKGWINIRDINGQTALHNIVKLSAKDQGKSRREGETALHEATPPDEICESIEALLEKGAWVDVQDCHGETALHEAMQSHISVVETLLSYKMTKDNFQMGINNRDKWIAMCDFSGETALHKATKAGQLGFVRRLLQDTKSRDDLLWVRDMNNMTALDYAALHKNVGMIDEMMKDISDITKGFLMWHLKGCNFHSGVHERYSDKYKVEENPTSLLNAAVNNNDVDIARELINKGADVTSLEYDARRWLAQNFGKKSSDLPTSEDTLGRQELVQGVATLLLNPYTQTPVTIGIFGNWGTGKSSFMLQVEEAMLHMAVKETFRKIPDAPSHYKESSVLKFSKSGALLRCMVVKALKKRMKKADNYNSSAHAKALLLKIIKGAQKCIPSSDIENQMPSKEMELQSKYCQLFKELALTNKPKSEEQSKNHQLFKDLASIDGSTLSKYHQLFKDLASTNIPNLENDIIQNSSMELQKKYRRLFKDLASIYKSEHDIINNFPMELQSKYCQLFQELALTDRSKLVCSHTGSWCKRKTGMSNQTLKDAYLIGYTPAVLTLRYNAWQYDNKIEASAGLAVEISHQLESFMTPQQWLRMCWEYSWKIRPREVCAHLLLPTFLVLVVVCVILILWTSVPIATKYKAISLPAGIVGVMWAFFKNSLRAIQSVTQTMLRTTKSIDHQSLLGYQHQVIKDIKFLKDQLCRDAHFGWKILSLFWQFFISNKYCMEGTWIWKQHPNSSNFRIVVFIDDLDRCDESTTLEILRAVNLILGSCGISVVIGVDKGMMERAIIREFLKDTGDNIINTLAETNIAPKKDGPEVDVENVTSNVQRYKNIVNDNQHAYMRELAETYLQKIIHLPIHLPEPSTKHIESLIQGQVGQLHKAQNNNQKNDIWVQEKKLEDEGDAQSHTSIEEHVEEGDEGDEGEEGDAIEVHVEEGQVQVRVEAHGILIEQEDHVKNEGDSQCKDKIDEEDQVMNEGDSQCKDKIDEEDQVMNKGDSQCEDKIEDGASVPRVFHLFLAYYTPMERDMLERLCKLATGEQRVPREWKRFLNYHRLAWTILSQDGELRRPEFKGWQRKLILWIFICWNWRDQMDVIFKNWHGTISKSLKSQVQKQSQDKDKKNDNNVNLSDMVNTYMDEMGWNAKDHVNQNRGIQGSEIEPKAWKSLHKILKQEYDISIHFIEKFQQFRFFCKTNYLETDTYDKPKAHLKSLKSLKSTLNLSH